MATKVQAESVLNCTGPLSDLSDMITPNTLAEVSKNVKPSTTGQKKRRGSYLPFTTMEKVQVVQYRSAVSMNLMQLCNDFAELIENLYIHGSLGSN